MSDKKNSEKIIEELYPNFHAQETRLTIPPAPECKKLHDQIESDHCPSCGKRVYCSWLPHIFWYIPMILTATATSYYTYILYNLTFVTHAMYTPLYYKATALFNTFYWMPITSFFLGALGVTLYSIIRYKRCTDMGFPIFLGFVLGGLFMLPAVMYFLIGNINCLLAC